MESYQDPKKKKSKAQKADENYISKMEVDSTPIKLSLISKGKAKRLARKQKRKDKKVFKNSTSPITPSHFKRDSYSVMSK